MEQILGSSHMAEELPTSFEASTSPELEKIQEIPPKLDFFLFFPEQLEDPPQDEAAPAEE